RGSRSRDAPQTLTCQAAAPSRTVRGNPSGHSMKAKRSIIDYLAESAARNPGHVVVHFKERKLTLRELEERSARCRGALAALGVKAGDRVALVMSDCPEMMIAMLAVMGMGAIA